MPDAATVAIDQRKRLVRALEKMVELLATDPTCPWTRGFGGFLAEARELDLESADGWSMLAASVMGMFGGMGSFTDFCPPGHADPVTGHWIMAPGWDQLEAIKTDVYTAALDLRQVGRY